MPQRPYPLRDTGLSLLAIPFARRGLGLSGLLLVSALCLTACNPVPVAVPEPVALTPVSVPAKPVTAPSERSQSLAAYYARVQRNALAQDLLRTGGGGVDTPYSNADLIANFEQLVFYNEFAVGSGMARRDSTPDPLIKWTQPVRIGIEFGAHTTPEQQAMDRAELTRYVARLSRITGHPITVDNRDPNFLVMVASLDDHAETITRFKEMVPSLGQAEINLVRSLPRRSQCFVSTFYYTERRIHKALALIRAEQPDLMRRACIHEEVAQGLGLRTDSDRARPSIFNDDQEFALLTTHDEALLRTLYHPSLRPGMTLDEARPIFTRLLADAPAAF